MKHVSFIESTVGTIKSIYRSEESSGLFFVSLKLTNCKRFIDEKNNVDAEYRFLIASDQKKSLFSIKKGDIVTVKETTGKVIQVMEGEHIPEKGKYEVVSYPIERPHSRLTD